MPQNHVCDHDVNNYVVAHENNTVIVANNINNVTVINNTNVYNNTTYNSGPPRGVVENAIGHKVEQVTIAETNKPLLPGQTVHGNSISIYRPAISQTTVTHAAPAHVVPLENVKAVNATAQHGVLKPQENSPKPPVTRPVAPAQTTPIPQNKQILSEPAQINDQPTHRQYQNPNANQNERPIIENQPKPAQNIEQPVHREEPNPAMNQNERSRINEPRPAQNMEQPIRHENIGQNQNNNQSKPYNQPKSQPKPKPQSQPKPAPRPATPERERR